jgi:hypothetical protein
LNFGHWYLPFDLAQGGEFFDFAQNREPVERLVEPFGPALVRLNWCKASSTAEFHLEVIHTIGVYSVWARDLYFGAWNFHDIHMQVTSFVPRNYLFQ